MKPLARMRPHWRTMLAVLAALALALVLSGDAVAPAAAGAPERGEGGRAVSGPSPGLDINIAVFSSSGVLKNNCDSLVPDYKCIVHPGETFTLEVYLDALPALPDVDASTVAGYTDMAVRLDYSPGLTIKPPPVNTIGTCFFAPEYYQGPGSITWACLQIGNEVAYTGRLFRVDFNCPPFKSKQTITLVPGTEFLADTYIIDENGAPWREAGPAETIVVNCDNVFPWDVDTSGQVSVGDIFQVVQHFGQVKPTP